MSGMTSMDAALTSDIADLQTAPLAEIDPAGLAATLRRINAAADDQRVPVAAFDSSI